MIVRIWHGRTRTSDAEAYRAYVTETGIPDYLKTAGNLGAQVWQRREGEITHIWTISWWTGMDAVRKFAGEPVEKAQYYPEDRRYLLELEEEVQHGEAWSFSGPQ